MYIHIYIYIYIYVYIKVSCYHNLQVNNCGKVVNFRVFLSPKYMETT